MVKLKLFLEVSLIILILFGGVTANNIVSYKNQKSIVVYDAHPSEGYILFTPVISRLTYLVDKLGNVVHTWNSKFLPADSAYLLENGNLLRTAFLGPHPNFLIMILGTGGGLQEIAPDGTIVWEFWHIGRNYVPHHDVEVLPNGNILMLVWEIKTYGEIIDAGRNPSKIDDRVIWAEYIIEVEPVGNSGGNIVWEWHVWDRLIQDYDSSKENFGVVEDHPELVDINYGVATKFWNHADSIDYNEDYDQILISVNNFNEIWVIDHSTTTEEAKGHTGGNSGKGGDILYRWGNPEAYIAGDANDQKLFGQHDANWIDKNCPGEGNILVFNNGEDRPGEKYSSVVEIIPPVDSCGQYQLELGDSYGPDEPIWVYTASNPTDFYSSYTGSVQRLANGNTLICDGFTGWFFEVTPEKEIIWGYTSKYPTKLLHPVFIMRHYSSDYIGLDRIIHCPEKPVINGPKRIEVDVDYNYTAITTDPDGDKIYYMFDWGDGTSTSWLGPFDSGYEIGITHRWSEKGNYDVIVKSKDISGIESQWSEPLHICMTKNKNSLNSIFSDILKTFQRLSLIKDGIIWK